MLVETCDVCGDMIMELNRENGGPTIEQGGQIFSVSLSVGVSRADNSGLSKRYMLCSTECLAQFAGYMHLCYNNPKYKEVPADDLLEGFMNGTLKPLVEVQQGVETEQLGGPTENQPTDPHIARILDFTRDPTRPTGTAGEPIGV